MVRTDRLRLTLEKALEAAGEKNDRHPQANDLPAEVVGILMRMIGLVFHNEDFFQLLIEALLLAAIGIMAIGTKQINSVTLRTLQCLIPGLTFLTRKIGLPLPDSNHTQCADVRWPGFFGHGANYTPALARLWII